MGEELQVSENELALIDVNSIADTLSTLIEQGTDTVMTFLASDEVADALETAKGIGEELSKAVKVVTLFRKPQVFQISSLCVKSNGIVQVYQVSL